MGFPGGRVVKNLPANAECTRDAGSTPWVGKMPWRRKWQPVQYSVPRKSHGQRSLVGYSPWGHTESDMTEQHAHIQTCSGQGSKVHPHDAFILVGEMVCR